MSHQRSFHAIGWGLGLVWAVLGIAASAVRATTPQYRWTLSTSLTDPYQNVALIQGGPTTLYLWFLSPTSDGMTSAEFALSTPASVSPLLFATYNGFLNSGGPVELRLSVGLCPPGPVVAGSWLLSSLPLGDYCLVTSSGGYLDTADCDATPQHWPIEVTCCHAGGIPGSGRWLISRSSTDPLANSGPLFTGAINHLYLWYERTAGMGMLEAWFSLHAPSWGLVAGFSPLGGFSNPGTVADLHLQVSGCPTGPVLAGDWTIIPIGNGGLYCLGDDSVGVLETHDCLGSVQGLDYGCYDAGPTAVEAQSWGVIKSDYR